MTDEAVSPSRRRMSSTPSAAHSSTTSPSHNSLQQLHPNQQARPRHSNPHSTCRTALRSLKRAFLPWRLSDADPAVRGTTFMGPHPKPFTTGGYAGADLEAING